MYNVEKVSREPICRYRLLFASDQINCTFSGSRSYVSGLQIGLFIAVALLGVRTRRCLITTEINNDQMGFCGCRPGCKKFLTDWRSDCVRSSVRPQFAAFSEAAGRYGDQRIGSKSLRRTRGSEPKTGFPNPDLFDHFAHSGHRLLAPSYRFQIVSPVSSQAATVFAGSR